MIISLHTMICNCVKRSTISVLTFDEVAVNLSSLRLKEKKSQIPYVSRIALLQKLFIDMLQL